MKNINIDLSKVFRPDVVSKQQSAAAVQIFIGAAVLIALKAAEYAVSKQSVVVDSNVISNNS